MSLRASDVERIFLEAVEQHEPDQWPAFVRQACAGDPEFRHRVEALLKAHGESNRLLDGEGVPATMTLPPIAERPGAQIDRYKLLEQIGEGGFGVVFMAGSSTAVAPYVQNANHTLLRFQRKDDDQRRHKCNSPCSRA